MRTGRILGFGTSYYHCVSRIVDARFRLNAREKERFRELMRRVAAFSGVEVLTYALMDNHIHLLLRVPEKRVLPEGEVLDRIAALYGRNHAKSVEKNLNQYRKDGQAAKADGLLLYYTRRMHDLSAFMKMLLQRYSQSYNRRYDRRGHLWEDRFKSVLIEGKPGALSTIAAYIDLNPVRAGVVKTPERYRYSGYGEAMAGVGVARRNLKRLCELLGIEGTWGKMVKGYRYHLYAEAAAHQKKGVVIDREKLEKTLREGGKLTLGELLHCRVRYLTDGVALGSRGFVETVFKEYRKRFGVKRKTGARKPRFADWGDLYTMRDLRVNPVSLSPPPE